MADDPYAAARAAASQYSADRNAAATAEGKAIAKRAKENRKRELKARAKIKANRGGKG